jgi:hypothetical protein
MKTSKTSEPSAASMREMPEVDARGAFRNPFARTLARTGIRFVGIAPTKRPHTADDEEPSAVSLREIPEVDLSRARRDPKRFAIPMAEQGITLQVGRGRPDAGKEVGPTSVRSVRFPASVWKEIERVAAQERISVHAALRMAVAAWTNVASRRSSRRANYR